MQCHITKRSHAQELQHDGAARVKHAQVTLVLYTTNSRSLLASTQITLVTTTRPIAPLKQHGAHADMQLFEFNVRHVSTLPDSRHVRCCSQAHDAI
jgi:hypothetical protein